MILIQIFYANLRVHETRSSSITTLVQSKHILISPSFLARIMNMPNKELLFTINRQFLLILPKRIFNGRSNNTHSEPYVQLYNDNWSSSLLPQVRILAFLIGHCIFPKSGGRGHHRITQTYKLFTYCVLESMKATCTNKHPRGLQYFIHR